VVRARANFRPKPKTDEEKDRQFQQVKARLERWFEALDARDPYKVLGVAPSAPTNEVRARFHELALENHPDRGGSADEMGRLNDAYERVLATRAEAERASAEVESPELALASRSK
jgi:DnaJ-domain-containing protein 1